MNDPKDRKGKRWIILSRIARAKVLAHELGHYFDLPHSKYPESIMNKKPRKTPPMAKRGFVPAEYSIMAESLETNESKRSSSIQEIQLSFRVITNKLRSPLADFAQSC